MTQTEYDSLLAQARTTYASMAVDTYKKIRDTYISASRAVADAIKAAEISGASQITYQGLLEIEGQLKIAAEKITAAINNNTLDLMASGVNVGSEINIDYLTDALKGFEGLPFTIDGVQAAYLSINELVVSSTVNRLFQDGYSFSERIWKIGENYQEEMKDIIAQGLAMGRSSIQIAGDIQAYVKDGQIALAQRYGIGLKRGDIDKFINDKTGKYDWKAFEEYNIQKYGKEQGKIITQQARSFMKRIGNRVDWRALRVARSELYMSLQDAAKEQGKLNPAATGKYEWVLEANREKWKCRCPEFAKETYTYETVPGYPHSNCRCSVRPILMDQKKFQEDMERWSNGEPVEYLDNWYNSVYKTYS